MGLTEQQVQAIIVRALKTFVQAFLAFLAAGIVNVTSGNAGKALVVGAFAAAVSAVINVFIQPTEAR